MTTTNILSMLGGLALFLYGMQMMGDGLEAAAGNKMKQILEKLTSMDGVTKITDNHYKVNMSSNDIKGLVSSADVDTSLITGNVNVDVYTENGNISKFKQDSKLFAILFLVSRDIT